MHIFISAGEPSGDLHGGNLARILRHLNPDLQCVGFGGEHMEAAGCKLLYPLARLSAMFILPVLAGAHNFIKLIFQADRYFRLQRPDAVVLIDYPGFNWWIARRAHAHGIPVFYFVPPQLWAWAGWRVNKMRRTVKHVLCSLPFEEAWYRQRNVPVNYVGHPYFDELPRQQLDEDFVRAQRALPGRIVGLLPGSRMEEVKHNLSTLARAAVKIHERAPDTRFLMACYREMHRDYVLHYLRDHDIACVQPFVRRTPEILHLARACIAVSGSVGLELLYHGKPSVVVYRVNWLVRRIAPLFLKTPYISLVNLLAGKTLFPEFLSDKCESQAVSEHVLRWLADGDAYREIIAELTKLREEVAKPGACERTAYFIMDAIGHKATVAAHQAA